QGHAPHRAPARVGGPAQGRPIAHLQKQLTGALALEAASDRVTIRHLHDGTIEVEIEDQVSIRIRRDRRIALQGTADAFGERLDRIGRGEAGRIDSRPEEEDKGQGSGHPWSGPTWRSTAE